MLEIKKEPEVKKPIEKVPEAAPVPSPVIPAKVTPRPLVGKDYTEPIKGIRKAMVKTMTAAQAIPPFGYYDEIDMTALVHFREEIKDQALARGVKFSYMPVFIKVCWYVFNRFFDVCNLFAGTAIHQVLLC